MFDKIKNYAVKDWVTIAMIAAVVGVVFTLLDSVYSPLSNLLGPLLISVTFGIYALSALLPMFIIRKPGAAIIGGLIAAVINILTGSPYGIHIVVAGLLQGLGAEIGFGLFNYKKFNFPHFALSAVFLTTFVTIRDYAVFSLSQLSLPILIATIAIRMASAIIVSYLICTLIKTALQKTGLTLEN